ncbi:UNVERIFIED_CONTAM: hypothetical protein Scaly_1153500 [Sesamum calycinum]|uniref:Transposase-associated domain-containing protein n=1 Tax=Sesamum calycinum TaxID=2727403 RepID=A0AAW2Q2L8_9LAMI
MGLRLSECAKGRRRHMDGDKIRCPCRKCKNTKFGTPDEVSYHLCMRVLRPEYYNWTLHGKDIVQDYFEGPSITQVLEEPTLAGHVEGVPDDGTRKKLVKDLGLPVEKIHACKNDCMLYWMDDVDLEYCKFCGNARYKPSRGRDLHQKKSPYAVLRYLPLTPVYRGCILRGRLLKESRNVRLGLSTDGFAPHELLQLWHVGVRTYDDAMDRAFMMRATLMWIVNGLTAYRMASGWSTAGVIGCPVCMNDTRAFHLKHGRKACYIDCHRQFLPTRHAYRRNKKAFTKNRVENKVAHPRLIGDKILDQVANISPTVEMPLSLPDGYGSDDKWTKKSIFTDLPYWSMLLIQHNFNVMHIEKNVF